MIIFKVIMMNFRIRFVSIHAIEKIQRIYNSAIGIDFRTGRDIEWTPGCLRLTRPAGSAVPY